MKNFFKKTHIYKYFYSYEICYVDFIIPAILGIFCFFLLDFFDLFWVSEYGFVFLEALFSKNMNLFYTFISQNHIYAPGTFPNILFFAILGVLQLPLYILGLIIKFDFKNTLIDYYWMRSVMVFLYIICARIIYLIGIQLNFSKNISKWMSWLWMTTPMAFYNVFIRSRFDSITVLILLLSILQFIKRRELFFCILMAGAMSFYPTMVFCFIPLILLIEKRVIHIIKYFLIGFSILIIGRLLFMHDPMVSYGSTRLNGLMKSFFDHGFLMFHGSASYFFVGWIALCIYSYIKSAKDDFEFNQLSIYIPLVNFSLMYLFVFSQSYWIMPLTIFTTIIFFINKKRKTMIYLDIALYLSYLLLSVAINISTVDMISNNILPLLSKYEVIFNNELYAMSNILIKISPIVYPLLKSIFAASSLAIIIINFPDFKFNSENKDHVEVEFVPERSIILFTRFIVAILLFIVPTISAIYFNKGNSFIDTKFNSTVDEYPYDLRHYDEFVQVFIPSGDETTELQLYFKTNFLLSGKDTNLAISIIDMETKEPVFNNVMKVFDIENDKVTNIKLNNCQLDNKRKYGLKLKLLNPSFSDSVSPLMFKIKDDVINETKTIEGMPTENEDTKDLPTENEDTKDLPTENEDTKDLPTENENTKDYLPTITLPERNLINLCELIINGQESPYKLDMRIYSKNKLITTSKLVNDINFSDMNFNKLNNTYYPINFEINLLDNKYYNNEYDMILRSITKPFARFETWPQYISTRTEVTFSGFAFKESDPNFIKSVFLKIDDQIYDANYGTRSEDIAKANDYPEIVNSGFSSKIPIKNLENGLHKFSIIFEDINGKYYMHTLNDIFLYDGHKYIEAYRVSKNIISNKNENYIGLLSDNSLDTRWDTGEPQKPGDEIIVELYENHSYNLFKLQLSESLCDYPIDLEIYISKDNVTWERSDIIGHNENEFLIEPIQNYKFIKFKLGSKAFGFYWSIHELFFANVKQDNLESYSAYLNQR